MVTLKLFGRPQVFLDDVRVSLPFKQAEALLYYLAMEGKADKLVIADLIWGDKYDAEKTRSNMRNAVYVLRKAFGRDFLREPTKNELCLNVENGLEVDAIVFCSGNFSELTLYNGDFLEGFYLKENELYNEWVEHTRQFCRALYSERLRTCIASSYSEGEGAKCEALCRRLMALDEFDETSYKYLIELHKDKQDYTGAIAVYTQLEKLLSEELFELPGQELRSIAEDVKRQRNLELAQIVNEKSSISAAARREKTVFYGRAQELAEMGSLLDAFISGARAVSVLVQGEAGIGKTGLAERVLSMATEHDAVVLRVRCYHAEESYILKPWQAIFEQLIDMLPRLQGGVRDQQILAPILTFFPYLKREGVSAIDLDAISTVRYANAEKVIAAALERFAQLHRLVFYFDDIQWADETSISLLRNLMAPGQGGSALFVLTCRDEPRESTEALFEDMLRAGLLRRFVLNRFDYDDTTALADLLLPEHEFGEDEKKQLYHETEGNPFFLIEVLNNIRYNGSLADITPNIRDVIRTRVSALPTEYRKLLELLAMFFDGAPFDMMAELSGKSEYELAEALEFLMNKRLVREEPCQGGVVFEFTHQKLLEYVYGEMSLAKRAVLHNKVGLCYERRLGGKPLDVLLYTKLIHHFENGNSRTKHLRYSVKYLYSYLNTAHEYYPVLETRTLSKAYASNFLAPDFEGVDQRLAKLSIQMEELWQGGATQMVDAELISDYCHMMGRYYIRKTDYEDGMRYIFRLKELNADCGTRAQQMYMIKANRQLICIYMNRYETERMNATIAETYAILQSNFQQEETAIWNRIEGLHHIMSGNVEAGISCLRQAIAVFEHSREKELYLFNLAASYAWLGEAQRNLGNYAKADDYYRHAIQLCEGNGLLAGTCTFYTYAGLAAFDSGNIDAAEGYLEKAMDGYRRVDLMWGRGMAYSYRTLVYLRRGDYAAVQEYLQSAKRYAERLESDYERGVICRIQGQLACAMRSDDALAEMLREYITEPVAEYVSRARSLLKNVYSPVDEAYLNELE